MEGKPQALSVCSRWMNLAQNMASAALCFSRGMMLQPQHRQLMSCFNLHAALQKQTRRSTVSKQVLTKPSVHHLR